MSTPISHPIMLHLSSQNRVNDFVTDQPLTTPPRGKTGHPIRYQTNKTPSTSLTARKAEINSTELVLSTDELLQYIITDNKKGIKDKKFKSIRNNYVSDPDNPEREPITPLMYACRYGKFNAVNALLDKNVDLMAKTTNNHTALHFAFSRSDNYEDRKKIAMNLIAKKGDLINNEDINGNTLAHIALAAGFQLETSLFKKLENKGLITNKPNNQGMTPSEIQQKIEINNSTLSRLVAINECRRKILICKSDAQSQMLDDINLSFCTPASPISVAEDTRKMTNYATSALKALEKFILIPGGKVFGFVNEFTQDLLNTPAETSTGVTPAETSTGEEDRLSEISGASSSNQSVCLSAYGNDNASDIANLDDFSDEDFDDDVTDTHSLPVTSSGTSKISASDWKKLNQLRLTFSKSFDHDQLKKSRQLTNTFTNLLDKTEWRFDQAFPAVRPVFQSIAQNHKSTDINGMFYRELSNLSGIYLNK